jgi:Restriction Enzyme Adenine Methylase Associated
MLLTKDYRTYFKVAFDSEEEIERVILENVGLLFGDYSLLLSKSKLQTYGGKGSIPDGVLIDFDNKQWYIIEVERGAHGTWQHIAPQVSKQLTAITNEETKAKLITQAFDAISELKPLRELLAEIDIPEMHIHKELQTILAKSPILALPIDEIPDDLEDYLGTLKVEFKLWTIEKYINDKGEIVYSVPDFTEAKGGPGGTETDSPDAQPRQGNLINRVVQAGILNVGDSVYMDYGPKGKQKTHFTGIIRDSGIELDGKVYSPSIAALRCIQSVSPSRTSSNGWVTWKTKDGALINDAYKKLLESEQRRSAV